MNDIAQSQETFAQRSAKNEHFAELEVVSIVNNSQKFWKNPSANWWNGVEAVGQTAAIIAGYATGIEEIELIYNTTTLIIDLNREP